jgi:hypothetical protein
MARASRQLCKAERLQFAANGRFIDGYPVLLEKPLNKILAPPANDAMHRWYRATFDDLCQSLTMHVGKLPLIARRFAIDEP